MKKILILFVVLLLIRGCTNYVAEEVAEEQLEVDGGDAEVEIDGEDISIEYSDGEDEFTIEGTTGDGWCDEDLFLNVEGMNEGNEMTYTINVHGVEESGDYEGLCKGEVILSGSEGSMYYVYYFDENEEHGHVILSGGGVFASYNMEYDF